MNPAGASAPLGGSRLTRSAPAALLVVATVLVWPGGVGAAEARGATVLMLAGNGLSAADRRLIEALRVYTSDVGCRVVLSGATPPDADSGALSRIERLARTENAEIVVWTSRRSDGGLAFYLLTVRDRDVRATDIAALGTSRAADSVALKIRSLLSSPASPATAPAPPPGGRGSQATAAAAPATETAAPSGTGPATEGRTATNEPAEREPPSAPAARPEEPRETADRPTSVETQVVESKAREPERPLRETSWVALRVGYDVAAPVDDTWVRQGLMVSADARLGETAFVAHLDAVITRTSAVDGGEVRGHLRDTPFGLALARRWSGSRLSIAAGPRVGLHVIDVGAASRTDVTDGTDVRGDTRRFSGGLGVWSAVELVVTRRLSLWLGASAEALLPARRFTLAGTGVVHTSPALLAAAAGLGIAIP